MPLPRFLISIRWDGHYNNSTLYAGLSPWVFQLTEATCGFGVVLQPNEDQAYNSPHAGFHLDSPGLVQAQSCDGFDARDPITLTAAVRMQSVMPSQNPVSVTKDPNG